MTDTGAEEEIQSYKNQQIEILLERLPELFQQVAELKDRIEILERKVQKLSWGKSDIK